MRRIAWGVTLLSATLAASVAAQRVEYSGAVQAASGKFIFTEPTTSWMFSHGIQIRGERWRFGATVPLILQNGSAVTYIGGVPVGTGGPNSGSVGGRTGDRVPMQRRDGSGSGGGGGGANLLSAAPRSGGFAPASAVVDSGFVEGPGAYTFSLGDPIVQAGTDLFVSADGARRLSFQGLAKIPVADAASGVGTGKFDYGAGMNFSAVLSSTFVFLDVSHWVVGDLPDLPLRDITGGAVGIGRTFGEMGRVSLMGTVSGATAVVADTDPPLSAGLGLGVLFGADRSLNLGGSVGLSESSADWTVWTGWRVGIGR